MIEVCCALIFHQGRLLAVQRHADTDHPNQWEFPGGKIEVGETAVECIGREIQEELGIVVRPEAFLYPLVHDYGSKQVKLYPFVCQRGMQELCLTEHQRYIWLNASELGQPDWQEADRLLIALTRLEQLHWFGQDDEDGGKKQCPAQD